MTSLQSFRDHHARGNDSDRTAALASAFKSAEAFLQLDGNGLPLRERAQRILVAAAPAGLDPRLYQLAWFVRKTCAI
jgi:hypothetical protein